MKIQRKTLEVKNYYYRHDWFQRSSWSCSCYRISSVRYNINLLVQRSTIVNLKSFDPQITLGHGVTLCLCQYIIS